MKNKVSIYFLRGLIRESGHWGDLKERFSSFLQLQGIDASLHFLDIAGSGPWYQLKSFSHLSQQVNFLRDRKPQRGQDEKKVLVAISLGGMIADCWARQYPEDWDQIILINTSMGGLNPFYERLRIKNLPSLLCILLTRNNKKKQELIFKLTCKESLHTPIKKNTVILEWIKIQNDRPVSFRNALYQFWSAFQYKSKETPPHPKTHLLVGGSDHLVSSACSKKLATLWNTPLSVNEKVGHDLPLDDLTWFMKELKKIIFP